MVVHEKKNRLRVWELALLCGIALAALIGTWLSGQQAALSEQIVRLHVIGASDTEQDQAIKLQVRDAILQQVEPWLKDVSSQEEAEQVLQQHLGELSRIGTQTAGVPVTAELKDNIWFPTKQYTDFALPAGRYTALRIVVGEGAGRNWWCVVFPPLCLGSVSETVSERAGSFSDGQIHMITGENEGYVVKFKALELWNEWTDRFSSSK